MKWNSVYGLAPFRRSALRALGVAAAVAGATFAIDQFLQWQKHLRRSALQVATDRSAPGQSAPWRWSMDGQSARLVPMMNKQWALFSPETMAPEFTLPDVAGTHQISLADMRRRKPVVLIVGSFGCDLFCAKLPKLVKLHDSYGKRAEFLFVYIKDAGHGDPVPELGAPTGNRLTWIRKRLNHFGIRFAVALDTADGKVARAFRSFPARLFIVDSSGHIALDLGVIPTGWDLKTVEDWLQAHPQDMAGLASPSSDHVPEMHDAD